MKDTVKFSSPFENGLACKKSASIRFAYPSSLKNFV